MKKRILSMLLVIAMVLSMMPTVFAAETVDSGTCGDNLTWTLDSEGTLTISGEGAMEDYGYGVSPWYSYREQIETVILESSVTTIGSCAFAECTNLTNVTIPDSVTSIGWSAFNDCYSLVSVIIGDGVTSIKSYAFQDCISLTSVIIGSGVNTISEWVFGDCSSLTSVKIPASVSCIYLSAFDGCSSLAEIVVDDNNANYSSDARGVLFDKNKEKLLRAPGALVGEYVIPEGVTEIGEYAFRDCNSVTSVTIPDSVTTISDRAFWNCDSLTEINAPANITVHVHRHESTVTAPTCTEQGYTTYTCNHCGSSYTTDFVSPTGHSYGQWVITVTPTLSSDGVYARTCGVCGDVQTQALNKLDQDDGFPFTQNEWQVLIVVNRERLAQGLDPLTGLPQLQQAADIREAEVAECFSHTRPNGTSCFTAFQEVEAFTYGSAGENIAYGYGSSEAVMHGWMNSSGHRANILGNYDYIGIGESNYSWVQMFAGGYNDLYTAFRLVLPESTIVPLGTDLADLGIYAVLNSNNNGSCYLPILPEYCTGYDPNTLGTQTGTVSVLGFTATFDWTVTFFDVPSTSYYAEAVVWASENKITTGKTATTFAPKDDCTRAQIVTFLWRSQGEPEPQTTVNPFSDVKSTDYYYKAVLWAVENGITTGTSETTFSPNDNCTRAQAVTFLWRTDGKSAPGNTTSQFTDLQTGAYYVDAVAWAVENGITTGMTDTTFSPEGTCIRGQIVTFLWRYMN